MNQITLKWPSIFPTLFVLPSVEPMRLEYGPEGISMRAEVCSEYSLLFLPELMIPGKCA
ncbi:hypothetical protein ACWKWF_02670 [Acinetobacter kookii]